MIQLGDIASSGGALTHKQEALLRIGQVVPHMIAAGIETSPENVAKFIASKDVKMVAHVLEQYSKRTEAAAQATENKPLEAVIALGYFLKNHRLNQKQITREMLTQVSGLPYEQILATAEQHLPDIQRAINSFRVNWVRPAESRLWGEIPTAEQDRMIAMTGERIATAGTGNTKVSASDIANEFARNGIQAGDKDTIRRDIDRLISTPGTKSSALEKYRPVGKQTRAPTSVETGMRIPGAKY